MAIFNLLGHPGQLIAGAGGAGGSVASTTTTDALAMQYALQQQLQNQNGVVYNYGNRNDYSNNSQELLLLIEEGE